MKPRNNRIMFALFSVLISASMVLTACGGAATTAAPKPTEAAAAPAATVAPAGAKLAVGIVLPTKDEPRWIQDETRFKDAFAKIGVTPEILFSEGDSAKEKANVESLIS